MHSISPPPATADTLDLAHAPPAPLDASTRARLQREMQHMLLEDVLVSQPGPLRSACEAAVARKRRGGGGAKSPGGTMVRTPSQNSKRDLLEGYFGLGVGRPGAALFTPGGEDGGGGGGYVRARSVSM